MNLIVAVDKNFGIGCANKLLYHIPEDLQYFKQKTLGKTVVMGDKTLKSLPGGKPLPNRRNIVMSLEPLAGENEVCGSVEELLAKVKDIPQDDVFVIGGQQIYELLMPYCSYAYITEIDAASVYDKHLHMLRDNNSWKRVQTGDWQTGSSGIKFRYTIYKNEESRI